MNKALPQLLSERRLSHTIDHVHIPRIIVRTRWRFPTPYHEDVLQYLEDVDDELDCVIGGTIATLHAHPADLTPDPFYTNVFLRNNPLAKFFETLSRILQSTKELPFVEWEIAIDVFQNNVGDMPKRKTASSSSSSVH